MSKVGSLLNRKFDLEKKDTSVKTELIAGLTTFMAKDVSVATYVLTVIFLLMFLFTH